MNLLLLLTFEPPKEKRHVKSPPKKKWITKHKPKLKT